MIVYLDASAAAKLVWREPESEALRGFLASIDDSPDSIRSSILLETEVRRAAARNQVSQSYVTSALEKLHLADVGRDLFTSAGLLPGAGLRSLDSLHIATALRMETDVFITYDLRQAEAARECGLHTSSPT